MDIALIGIGKIARDAHVPAIAASPDWELAATVSRLGRVDGVQDYPDLDTLFAQRPDIRVVSLCLPPVPRFEYAVQALSAGRHVMLEKPPGATLAEVHALEALARAHRVSLFATWHSREAAGVAAAKSWLAGRTLRSLRVVWKEDVRRWHPGQDWIWEPGGMGVFDPGINALSIVTEILPVPIHVTAAVLEVPENRQTPIAARLDFYHPGRAEITADFDFRHQGEQTWTIEAETDAGLMRLTGGGAHLSVDGGDLVDPSVPALAGEYPRLYAKFAQLIQRGGCDVDLAPMRLVADALALGRRVAADPFNW